MIRYLGSLLRKNLQLLTIALYFSGFACFLIPILFWTGVFSLNPINGVPDSVLCPVISSVFCKMETFARDAYASDIHFIGGLAWVFVFALIFGIVSVLREIAKEPSWKAYRAKIAERDRIEAEERVRRTNLGSLIGIQIVRGGTDTTIIETESSFIRVVGIVNRIQKGVEVWQVGNRIQLSGSDNTYPIF